MAAPLGLEPRTNDPESSVLPLHHGAVKYLFKLMIACLPAGRLHFVRNDKSYEFFSAISPATGSLKRSP